MVGVVVVRIMFVVSVTAIPPIVVVPWLLVGVEGSVVAVFSVAVVTSATSSDRSKRYRMPRIFENI